VASFPYRTPAQPPPDAVVPTDEASRLGALKTTYVPEPPGRGLLPLAVVWLVILGFTLAPTGTFKRDHDLGPILVFLLASTAAAFLVLVWPALRRRDLRIALHEGGLVTHLRGARDVVIFEDVSELWFDLRFSQYGQARVTGFRLIEASGAVHHVSGYVEDAVALLNAVLRRCSEPLIAEARTALREGEALTFGKVRIDREGITIGKATAAWSELSLVRFQPGKALFLRGSSLIAWRTVRHDSIPHPTVFLRMVGELAPRSENDESLSALLK
jgi:uncharacterized protein DUF6585